MNLRQQYLKLLMLRAEVARLEYLAAKARMVGSSANDSEGGEQ